MQARKKVTADLQDAALMSLQTMARTSALRIDRLRVAMLTEERPGELASELERTEHAIELLLIGAEQVRQLINLKRKGLR
jgi:hypothetical protein